MIDFIPVSAARGRTAFQPVPGGSPYNTAVAVSRLEVPNAFLGRISRDFFGDQLVEYLRDNGVATDMVVRGDELSTLAFVSKSDDGAARYAFYAKDSADRGFSTEDVPDLPAEAMAIQFGSIGLIGDPAGETVLSLVERERERRVCSFDPNVRASLVEDETVYRSRVDRGVAAATIVKVSDEDLAWMTGSDDISAGAADLIKRGPELVVVTAGAQGATAYTRNNTVGVDAEKATVSDTVGAGDSFHAALLSWCYHAGVLRRERLSELSRTDMERMLGFAGAVAAITCSRAGADPPKLSEIAEHYRSW